MDPEEEQLRRLSEAFDGEGEMPEEPGPEGVAFLAGAERVRSALRLEDPGTPPDVSGAVLERVRSRRRPRRVLLLAAAVFVVAALTAAIVVRSGAPGGPEPALADVDSEVLAAQQRVERLDARVSLVERGVHPEVPVRRYEGTLRYRAPEKLWLSLNGVGDPPEGWPGNDLDVVVDEGTAWSHGLVDCPVGRQPACLDGPRTHLERGLAPFAPDFVAPLELVVPAAAFLPGEGTTATRTGDVVVVDTTAARVDHLLGALRAAGALRGLHASDRVRLELDARSFTLRRLTVTAADTDARALFASSTGYDDEPGDVVIDLVVEPADLPDAAFPPVPGVPADDAGFVDGPVDGVAPEQLPDGFSAHRHGRQGGSGPTTTVRSWTDGRAWIRLDATRRWDRAELFGDVGPLVRRIEVGGGVGYTDPGGTVVSVHGDEVDLALRGSVPLETLVRVASSIDLEGRPVPEGWDQGRTLEELPDGALRPPGPLTARYDGAELLVAIAGPGRAGAVLAQRPGELLPVPPKADVVGVEVRGASGRYSPALGTLSWAERGWIVELRSDGLDLGGLLEVAEEMEPA